MVKAFDSNDLLSHLQLSNPFGGKSSNLLGVDIFLLFCSCYSRWCEESMLRDGILVVWKRFVGLAFGRSGMEIDLAMRCD